MTQREAMAIVVSAGEIPYGLRARALDAAGSAENLLADPHAYAKLLGEKGVAALRRALRDAERMLDRLAKDGVALILRGEAGYPERLSQIAKPPHLLFCLGESRLCDPAALAVVGTRSADPYGVRHTRRIALELAQENVCVVSGLALGIDAAAHMGALDGRGRTVAVLGGALDKFYPAANRPLMQRILENGGSVVTEYAPGTPPTRYSFLQRNRIIAGLSMGVLVTQAPMKSGALSTVHCALDEGREVFALPGDIDRPGAQLPNRLIAEGARPVSCAKDITALLVGELPRAIRKAKAAPAQEKADAAIEMKAQLPARALDENERAVYDLLLAGDMDFDALCERTGMASDALGTVLMMMELDGMITSLPGMTYTLG